MTNKYTGYTVGLEAEIKEVEDRFEQLSNFLARITADDYQVGLTRRDIDLLYEQQSIMSSYLNVLNLRLSSFTYRVRTF